jgi:hypothetical protein
MHTHTSRMKGFPPLPSLKEVFSRSNPSIKGTAKGNLSIDWSHPPAVDQKTRVSSHQCLCIIEREVRRNLEVALSNLFP